MGRHRRAPVKTPLYDFFARGMSIEEWALLPEWVHDAVYAETGHMERDLNFWRGLLPPPEAHSPLLPAYLGVTEPTPRVKTVDRRQWCTQRHHAAWQAKQLAMRFLQWFVENKESPTRVAKRHYLRANTLCDHLAGKSVMQDDVAKDWIKACNHLELQDRPDPLLYYWRNRVYRWPEMPLTVAAQHANFTYPADLADYAQEAMYAYDEPCYCRVLTWNSSIRALGRTGEPGWYELAVGATRARGEETIDMLNGFHPEYRQRSSRAELMARLSKDPAEVVADYIRWSVSRHDPEPPPGFLRGPDSPPEWARSL